ncbi:Oligopeptide transport system permease protein appC [Proteiniborus sp. DW1]|uniref:ABC transporter permease n=1 Tax=Proteiniborus sp. DW1 TaxID=1889883 RepID=UPI00092DFAA0|nr:ABC transporter permease [Proteiniborus sp. DW1]SCG81707.1 Oligopeptide transport system permease protein appC [Proteiniborus sp. DW1]
MLNSFKKLSKTKKASAIILITFLLIAVFSNLLMPYSQEDISHPRLLKPSTSHLLGTDEIGHDIFSLLIYGFRITILTTIVSGFFTTLIGTSLAYISAYYGGIIKTAISEIANLFVIVPEIVMIMFFSSLARPKLIYTIMAIVFFSWPKVYKIALFKIMNYMEKSKVKYTLLIKGNWFDVLKKLLPDILPVMSTFFVLQCNKAVMYEASLSFFGIGDPLKKTWGKLIRAALDYDELYYDSTFLWYLIPPVLCLILFVISLTLLSSENKEL